MTIVMILEIPRHHYVCFLTNVPYLSATLTFQQENEGIVRSSCFVLHKVEVLQLRAFINVYEQKVTDSIERWVGSFFFRIRGHEKSVIRTYRLHHCNMLVSFDLVTTVSHCCVFPVHYYINCVVCNFYHNFS